MDVRRRGRRWLPGFAAPASAQSWPTQRVTIVVPFGAGSVTDILARIFADEMGKRWGQQVIVENRPGIAGTAARRQGRAGRLHADADLQRPHRREPGQQGRAVRSGEGFRRHHPARLRAAVPDHPSRTCRPRPSRRSSTLAKEKPGKLNFSSPGLASTTFIAGALFRKAAGINIVHVPFRSAPDAVTAVIRGDAQLYFAPVNLARDQSQAGKVRRDRGRDRAAHSRTAEHADLHRGRPAVRL